MKKIKNAALTHQFHVGAFQFIVTHKGFVYFWKIIWKGFFVPLFFSISLNYFLRSFSVIPFSDRFYSDDVQKRG